LARLWRISRPVNSIEDETVKPLILKRLAPVAEDGIEHAACAIVLFPRHRSKRCVFRIFRAPAAHEHEFVILAAIFQVIELVIQRPLLFKITRDGVLSDINMHGHLAEGWVMLKS